MVSETTNTSTSSTAPANPDVNNTISKLAKGIGDQVVPGASVFTPPGATTVAGQNASLTAAGNPLYGQGIDNAIKSFGDVAAGNQFGQLDPQYQQIRSKAMQDAITGVGSGFNAAGRYGGGSYVDAATTAAGNVAANMDLTRLQQDEARQQQAAGILPGLFSAAQLPSSVQQSVGASQDAAQAAQAAGPTDFLAKLTAISSGNAGGAGQVQTNTQPGTPLWQSLLGLGIGGAGLFAR